MQTLASERAGFTAFHVHLDSEQRGPGHNASLDVQSGLLREGDRIAAVRIYSQAKDGKTLSADDLAKAQAEVDKKLPSDPYVLPLREDQFSDYKVETAACDQCPAGSVELHFTSLKRDAVHGDGTMLVDAASHHIVRIDFVPSAFPKYVDKANVTLTYGRVLPDLWDVVEMRQHYEGHMLMLKGGADVTTSFTNYRRVASLDDGIKTLASGI